MRGGDDCDDDDADVHPVRWSSANDRDDDCDGQQPVATQWFVDADHDGYGDAKHRVDDCDAPSGYVADDTDCDDGDPDVSPSDPERCDNTIDDDCDGTALIGDDADGDGFFAETCLGGDDCDDGAPDIHVGAVDECGDGIDSDCSGRGSVVQLRGDYDLAKRARRSARSRELRRGRLVEAGDVTGDGNDDVFVATLYGNGGMGGGYIVPGPVLGDGTLEESGFRIESSSTTYGASRSIGLGDANGDGIEDVSFGAPYSTDNGQYIVFGPITADMELASAADAWLTGRSGIFCGHGSDLGDLDDDGYEDAVIGAYWDRSGGRGSGTTVRRVRTALRPRRSRVRCGRGDRGRERRRVRRSHGSCRRGHRWRWPRRLRARTRSATALADRWPGASTWCTDPRRSIRSPTRTGSSSATARSALAGSAFTVGDFDGDGPRRRRVVRLQPRRIGRDHTRAREWRDRSLDVRHDHRGCVVGPQLGSGLGSGDVDLDGIDELLIGAPGDSESGEHWCGAAFLVFSPPSGTWEITDVASASFWGVRQSDNPARESPSVTSTGTGPGS
jgi:hypothetical protein